MSNEEHPTDALAGMYRDRLLDAHGQTIWDRGWKKNAIVTDCRRLLASFMAGAPAAVGIVGMHLGTGLDTWDGSGTPPATSAQVALVDPAPYEVTSASLSFDFLNGNVVSATPTNRLQIVVNIGPGMPSWPDANHVTTNLREFGLIAELDGAKVLINYVTHPVIAKDPLSTLERMIWLVF